MGVVKQCIGPPSLISKGFPKMLAWVGQAHLSGTQMALFGRQTLTLLFHSLCLPPLPAFLKTRMPHNNEEFFHISLIASQPLSLVYLFIQSPWQREVKVDFFLYLWLAGLVFPLSEAYPPHTPSFFV